MPSPTQDIASHGAAPQSPSGRTPARRGTSTANPCVAPQGTSRLDSGTSGQHGAMHQPIKVPGHSLIDYGFFAVATLGPTLLGLRGPARLLPLAFGATQGTLNALTDQPYAVKRVVPFKLHGRAESLAVPGFALAVATSGALAQPRAKPFLGALIGALAVVYTLTDWKATAPSA